MNKTSNSGFPLTRPQSSNSGFTLLELMIVIIIVGIMFSFITLSIRGKSPEDLIETEAHRLIQLIQLALEEAVLRGEEYSIIFKPDSYQFARLTDNGWTPIDNDRQLRLRELPHDITIELEIERSSYSFPSTEPDNKDAVEPQVFLLSSGEITPEFTLDMAIFGIDTSYRISGQMNGELSIDTNAF